MSKKRRCVEFETTTLPPYRPEFRNESQRLAFEASFHSDVVFLIGQAGCGKTHGAALITMEKVMASESCKVYFVRTAVEATGESIGAIPGDVSEKMDPYVRPMKEELSKVCKKYRLPVPQCEVVPLCFMRGRNFENCVVWIDEAQNLNRSQFKLAFGRMCENSHYIVAGDYSQTDIHDSYFREAVRRVMHLPRVSAIEFKEHENARHPLVPHFNRLL